MIRTHLFAMKTLKNQYELFLIIIVFVSLPLVSAAQNDTIKKKTLDDYLLTRKGMFGKLAKVLMTDTTEKDDAANPQRNDIRFQKYKDKVIRHIEIKRLNFGIPITDTTKAVSTSLTRLSNKVHHKTLERVIENNLFFRKNDLVQPYLLADNERYLRDLTYLNDAKILLVPIPGNEDSVDIIVYTKDVLSIGASVESVDLNNTAVELTEENLGGVGDRIALQTLYDQSRATKFGYGLAYIRRNISGSFIDGYFGYQNFNKSITGNKEETIYYVKLVRPLANSYMRWTYSLEAYHHETKNMYSNDSVYKSDDKYNYNTFDVWGGLNFDASKLDKYVRGQRLRGLVGLRFLTQRFNQKPLLYKDVYDSRYANVTGVLASISLFAQDFYKTQYIYGFGRNEDVPEGIDIGITSGWTRKQNLNRPYLGMHFERNYFTTNKHYFDFTMRVEGSLYKKKFEDITLLGNVDFFNRLKTLGRWKQRTFLSAGIARQINSALNEPLFLESQYGLPEFRNDNMGGYFRATLKGESVFYIPGSIASFRFAPFVFYNTSLFTPKNKTFAQSRLYTSLGGGMRARNESLIFGTLELRAYFFPRRNSENQSFKIDFNTDLKFKYNSQLIRRPEFIQAN